MALFFLITEQSTVPCFSRHSLIPWDHFGADKKKSGDYFGVGIISESIWGSFEGWDHFGVGIISGAVQTSCFGSLSTLLYTSDLKWH